MVDEASENTVQAPEMRTEPMTWRQAFQPGWQSLIANFLRWDATAKRYAGAILGSGFAEWAAILAAVATVGVAFFTALQIWIDLDDRKEERAERIAGRIERAYETLTRRMSGDIGKGTALTLLVKSKVPLGDLDLSCQAIGRWDTETAKCKKAPVFNELKMYDEDENIHFQVNDGLPDLHDAVITNSDLRYVRLGQGKTNGVVISTTDMRQSFIADKNVAIVGSDLSGSAIMPDANAISINGTNISGMRFVAITWLKDDNSPAYNLGTTSVFHNASWYWSDNPPIVVNVQATPASQMQVQVPIRHEDLKGVALKCDVRDRRTDNVANDPPEWWPFGRYEATPRLKRVSSIALTMGNAAIHSPECYEAFKEGNVVD